MAEPYRFLVIADLPVGFEGDAFRRLASIASTGARCGVYTLIVNDTGIYIQNGKGASLIMVGPTVNVNNGALTII